MHFIITGIFDRAKIKKHLKSRLSDNFFIIKALKVLIIKNSWIYEV